jgi:hypothetical protein
MKIIRNESAISEVMAILMLVLVAVSVSATYYTWISNLQGEVQTTGTEVAETRMDSFMSEIEVVCYPEYQYYNTDSNLDGKITANSTLDERFIQEIRVLVINKALFNLTNVKVKAVSFGDGDVDWAGLHFDRSNGELLDREEESYQFCGDTVNFTSETASDTSMRFFTDEGYSYFALNSTVDPVDTTTLADLMPLHNPTYKIGTIQKGEQDTGYVYLLMNCSTLPAGTALKLYITNDQGVDAYQTIQFKMQ